VHRIRHLRILSPPPQISGPSHSLLKITEVSIRGDAPFGDFAGEHGPSDRDAVRMAQFPFNITISKNRMKITDVELRYWWETAKLREAFQSTIVPRHVYRLHGLSYPFEIRPESLAV
jgi:hypothetical protein